MKKINVAVCLVLVLFIAAFVSAGYVAAADRFVDNKNGTVTDTQTGLMWAVQDNGSDINWYNAKSYCEGYSKGGGSWRLPTQSELSGLFQSGLRSWGNHAIRLTGYSVWASEERTSIHGSQDGGDVYFVTGSKGWFPKSKAVYNSSIYTAHRALPVRKAQ